MLRRNLLAWGAMICLLVMPSCEDDDDDIMTQITNFSGAMNGTNEVPAVTTTATGNVSGTFDANSKILTITVTYSGLSSDITMWHVHKGAVGVSGPPVAGLNFGTLGASPFTWSSGPIDATMESDLMNNLWYVNIHTVNNGGGEIRGQLAKQ